MSDESTRIMLTTEQLEGMDMWDRDPAVFQERSRPIWAMLVRSAVAEIRHHRAAVQAFSDTVEDAVRANANRGKGGQQVPFHGDFCAATPSVLNRLEWWARRFKETT